MNVPKIKLHRASYLLIIALIAIAVLLVLSTSFAVSTNPCSSCHGPQGYSETLAITGGQIPSSLNVGQTVAVTALVKNTVVGTTKYSGLTGVSASLSSQNGHFTVSSPTISLGSLNSGSAVTVSWQITGASTGSDVLKISVSGRNSHQSLSLVDSVTPSPAIIIAAAPTTAPTAAPTPTAMPTPTTSPTPTQTQTPISIPTPTLTPTTNPTPTLNSTPSQTPNLPPTAAALPTNPPVPIPTPPSTATNLQSPNPNQTQNQTANQEEPLAINETTAPDRQSDPNGTPASHEPTGGPENRDQLATPSGKPSSTIATPQAQPVSQVEPNRRLESDIVGVLYYGSLPFTILAASTAVMLIKIKPKPTNTTPEIRKAPQSKQYVEERFKVE